MKTTLIALSLFFSITQANATQVGDSNTLACNISGSSYNFVEQIANISADGQVTITGDDTNGHHMVSMIDLVSYEKGIELNRKMIENCGKSNSFEQLVQVTLPAGTFTACKMAVINGDGTHFGYIYNADVPFSTVKYEFTGGECHSIAIHQ